MGMKCTLRYVTALQGYLYPLPKGTSPAGRKMHLTPRRMNVLELRDHAVRSETYCTVLTVTLVKFRKTLNLCTWMSP